MNIKSVVVHEIKKIEKTTGAEVILTDKALDHCNGQLKPDTFLSHFPIKFPLKIQWCFIT
jgi:hypothetical protein